MKHPPIIFAVSLVLASWQTLAKAQATVDLGSAANFTLLAGSGLTVAGAVNTTAVTGDIGSFPTATMTGLENMVLTGVNQMGDATTQTAQIDLFAAYTDAVGRSPTATYTPVFDLGGLTLTAGVYNDPSSLAITGTLTLDAQGNSAAVWIFQAGSTLTTADASQVLLLNGALAENVFWQVGASATLGAASSFVGSILSQDSISVGTTAVIDGRLLALNAAVTMAGSDFIGMGAVPEPAATSILMAGWVGLALGGRSIRRSHARRKQQRWE